MKKAILTVIAGIMILMPAAAQSRKVVKKAKEDAKFEVSALKEDGYKTIDNVKLEDAVNSYLTAKYSDKSAVEVLGKAVSKDLNEAKAEARRDALQDYPGDEILNSFFVYKKSRKQYEVVCYALLTGRSAKDASKDKVQSRRRSEGTEATIEAARSEKEAKEAKAKAKKEKQKAEKAKKKAEKKAEKKAAEKAAKKAAAYE